MWELDHKEGWVPKNWYFQNVVLEKSPLDCKKIKPVNPKGNQTWIFIGRTDVKAKAPILWLPDAKGQLAGKDWCWERLRAGEGGGRGWDGWITSPTQWTRVWANSGIWWRTGKPVYCSLWGHKELGMTEQLNNSRKKQLMEVENSYSDIQREALVPRSDTY